MGKRVRNITKPLTPPPKHRSGTGAPILIGIPALTLHARIATTLNTNHSVEFDVSHIPLWKQKQSA